MDQTFFTLEFNLYLCNRLYILRPINSPPSLIKQSELVAHQLTLCGNLFARSAFDSPETQRTALPCIESDGLTRTSISRRSNNIRFVSCHHAARFAVIVWSKLKCHSLQPRRLCQYRPQNKQLRYNCDVFV